MPEISAKCILSESYYRSYWKDSSRHRKRFRRWEVPFGILLIIVGVALLWAYEWNRAVRIVPPACIFLGVYELVWHFAVKWRWFYLMRSGPQFGGEVQMRFSSEGIDHVGPTASGKIQWCGIEKIIRADEGLFLTQGRGFAAYIPYMALSSQNAADVIEEFHRGATE